MAERVVHDFSEFSAAVADTSIDTIFFGADIELTSPITILANRPPLIFDGTHEGVTYRLTDMDSNQPTDTLAVGAGSSIALTFQNMNMTGRNYYGIPCVSENGTSGVTVTYRNITYVGPQLAFNSQGLTHFENVDITISASTASNAEEVGEVCRVEFSGTNNIIRHNSTSDAVFWFRGPSNAAYFKLLSGARLTVDTVNYFMFSSLVLMTYPVAYEIQQDASFTLNSHHGISYDGLNLASSFVVGTGASFRYIQAAPNGTNPSLYLTGAFAVNEGASVYMQADFANSQPLIHYPSGSGTALSLNNPKSFVLYNRVSAPISVALFVTRSYTITAEQLNHWTAARAFPEAGTFIDTPQNKWNNSSWATFNVNGNVTMSSTTANSTGLVNPPTPIANFSFQTARVISAGNLTIAPDPVVDNGRPITGLTEPNARLIISFTAGGTPHSFTLAAGDDGRFELDPKTLIPIGTIVSISANTPFLIKTIETPVVSAGDITIISAPDRIVFKTPPISTNPVLLRRPVPDEPVKVDDSRPYPTEWNLLASITGPLQAASGEVLKDAVVYKDDDGNLSTLDDEPIVVYTGGPITGETDVFWTADKGILVRVTQPIRSGTEYSTKLRWALEIIDEP